MSVIPYPNALYARLAIQSTQLTADSGRSLVPIGPHVRCAGGIRIAALGLAAEHCASTFAFKDTFAVPTAITVSQRDVPEDLTELELTSKMRHRGRSSLVTTMRAQESGASEILAFGTITWTVLQSTGPAAGQASVYTSTPTGNLAEVSGVVCDGETATITAPGSGILGPGGILHAGALQTLAEEAALAAAAHVVEVGSGEPAAPQYAADATFYFIRSARTGPFHAHASILHAEIGRSTDVEVEVREGGPDGRPCTVCRIRVANRR